MVVVSQWNSVLAQPPIIEAANSVESMQLPTGWFLSYFGFLADCFLMCFCQSGYCSPRDLEILFEMGYRYTGQGMNHMTQTRICGNFYNIGHGHGSIPH